jgi:hypothetical protein
MPALLTAASTLMCPHGGTVMPTPGATRAIVDAPILRASDTFTIVGCPFATAAGSQPCVTVQWVSTGMRVKHGGDFVLTEASVGLCIGPVPQGTVQVAATQAKVSGL